jgi:predicted Zn-dependent protease
MVTSARALVCAASLTAGLALGFGCATNPATGKKEFNLMSEAQEIQMGREADAQVRQEMGIYKDAALQQYVNTIGQQLARVSDRPNLEWHFAVVDQPAVNAFALPGGFVYITRGILPFLQNEAQLAGVLGHEIGHVTARHSASQYSKATGASVGLALLGIFVPEAQQLQGAAETALSLLFLKYGRDDELEADRLGAGYEAKGGWDPHALAGMLTTLGRLDQASGSRKGVPNWLSTHPTPADRVQKVNAIVQQLGVGGRGNLQTDRSEFLQHVDGIVYGDSPEQGVVRGNEFLHADLRFALTFPKGWEVQNSAQQVVAKAPEADAYLLLQLVSQAQGTLQDIAVGTMQNAGLRPVAGGETRINGLDAFEGTYVGNLQGLGAAGVRAAHVVYAQRVYLLAGLAPQQIFSRFEPQFSQSIESFRALSAEQAAAIRPDRVDLYVVRDGDTWPSIAGRNGGDVKPSTLAIMNGEDPSQPPPVGQRIKVVLPQRL